MDASAGGEQWIDAPGGVRLRVAHWPQGARGVVLLLNGRTEFIEKYAEPVAALQERGFAVWTMDLRGQGRSTRPLADRLRHHVVDFEQYLADVDLVLDSLVLPSLAGRPLVLIGHSMGGHLAARLLGRHPGLFARAVLLSPMIDFLRGGLSLGVARALFRAACGVPGFAGRFGPGMPRAPMLTRPFAGNRLTSCPERYAGDIALAVAMPEVQLGGVTWGWLRAAVDSVLVLRARGFAEAIATPVLLVLAGAERIVDNRAARALAARLPAGELVVVEGAAHELLREQDRYRLQAWAAIDAFLAPIR